MTYPVIGDRIVPMGRRGESSQVGWFGKALRDAMDEAEISVLELARRLGTDPTLIRKWLKSTSVPSVERAPEPKSSPSGTMNTPTVGVTRRADLVVSSGSRPSRASAPTSRAAQAPEDAPRRPTALHETADLHATRSRP